MKFKDKRMKISHETFNNIKILKLYSWENEFKNKINKAREEELLNKDKNNKIENINSMIQWSGPVFTSLLSIGLFQYIKGEFKIEDIFTALNLFNKIEGPLRYLPRLLSNFYETTISTQRIEKFLNQEEINPYNINNYSEKTLKIKIENGNFSCGVSQTLRKFEKNKDKDNKKKKNVQKKEEKIYQEIELVEKINIPDDNKNNYLKLEKK